MSTPFDLEEVFDERDYLYFYSDVLLGEKSDAAAERIWALGAIEPGERVLDLACGHGRIANRLAARGAKVTGFDLTPHFLDRARVDAATMGVAVEYVQGDMRTMQWAREFDVVVNWFTSFGYFDDDTDRRVLETVGQSLRSGGRLLMGMNQRCNLLRRFLPATVTRRGEDLMLDEHAYDSISGRMLTERTVIRDGRQRRFK